jgi:glycosyltransferase involved in cell wall biosynthesis
MKVLNVQPFDCSGSIQRRSLQVSLELRKEGIDTVFVVPKEGFSFTKMALENDFKVYKTSSLRPVFINGKQSLIHMVKWIRRIPKNIVEMYKIVCGEQPDVIQVNGFVCIQEALVATFCYRRKFLWNLIGTLYPRIIILLFLPIIRSASLRVFVSKKLVNYYFGKPKDWIIYEPVDTDKFNPNRIALFELDVLRKTLSLGVNSHMVGFLGFISPVKGLEYLIRSIKLVKEKCNDVKLVIAGGVPPHQQDYYIKLKNLVCELKLSKDIIFVDYVEHEKVPLVLRLFNIFVFSSTHEGTPVSILEAMAMEIPVVATDVGGVSEQIVNGETSILVPPKDPEAIAEAIIRLLQNPEERIRMGRRSRKRVQEMFSLEKCVLMYKKLYGDILANVK